MNVFPFPECQPEDAWCLTHETYHGDTPAPDQSLARGIYEVYGALHPKLQTRAYWQMGIDEWHMLLRSEWLRDQAMETPGSHPFAPSSRMLLDLPVSVSAHGDVALVVRAEAP